MESRSYNLWTDTTSVPASIWHNAGDRNPAGGSYRKLGHECIAVAGVKWLEGELGYRKINCVRTASDIGIANLIYRDATSITVCGLHCPAEVARIKQTCSGAIELRDKPLLKCRVRVIWQKGITGWWKIRSIGPAGDIGIIRGVQSTPCGPLLARASASAEQGRVDQIVTGSIEFSYKGVVPVGNCLISTCRSGKSNHLPRNAPVVASRAAGHIGIAQRINR